LFQRRISKLWEHFITATAEHGGVEDQPQQIAWMKNPSTGRFGRAVPIPIGSAAQTVVLQQLRETRLFQALAGRSFLGRPSWSAPVLKNSLPVAYDFVDRSGEAS